MDASSDNPFAGSRTAIETYLKMSSDAFEAKTDHSLLATLWNIPDEYFTMWPAGGGRTIADILEHVGWAKWMYNDYAFGPATLRGDQPPMIPGNGAKARPRAELMAWITEGHQRWVTSIGGLANDAELEQERPTNWGSTLPIRMLISIQIAHDFYHAGEINHINALLSNTDRWPYDL
jgi:hypothetical protein